MKQRSVSGATQSVRAARRTGRYEYKGGNAAGFASGGFLADSVVHGAVAGGSQQQWITRNSRIGKFANGVWNMVFVGVEGAPPPHCGADPKLCAAPCAERPPRDHARCAVSLEWRHGP